MISTVSLETVCSILLCPSQSKWLLWTIVKQSKRSSQKEDSARAIYENRVCQRGFQKRQVLPRRMPLLPFTCALSLTPVGDSEKWCEGRQRAGQHGGEVQLGQPLPCQRALQRAHLGCSGQSHLRSTSEQPTQPHLELAPRSRYQKGFKREKSDATHRWSESWPGKRQQTCICYLFFGSFDPPTEYKTLPSLKVRSRRRFQEPKDRHKSNNANIMRFPLIFVFISFFFSCLGLWKFNLGCVFGIQRAFYSCEEIAWSY